MNKLMHRANRNCASPSSVAAQQKLTPVVGQRGEKEAQVLDRA